MAIDSKRGTKRQPIKMSPKEKRLNKIVNDVALGKKKKKKENK